MISLMDGLSCAWLTGASSLTRLPASYCFTFLCQWIRVWEVRVEGAVSYAVTFDSMTKTEHNHDFVRFVKVRDLNYHTSYNVFCWFENYVLDIFECAASNQNSLRPLLQTHCSAAPNVSTTTKERVPRCKAKTNWLQQHYRHFLCVLRYSNYDNIWPVSQFGMSSAHISLFLLYRYRHSTYDLLCEDNLCRHVSSQMVSRTRSWISRAVLQ